MRFLFRAKCGENFWPFAPKGRRKFFWEPYYFLYRRAAETRDTGSRPARRAEAALLSAAPPGTSVLNSEGKGFLLSLHQKCLPRIFFPEFCPSKLLTPLFFSPQHPAHSAGPAQNEWLPRPFGVFFSNFCCRNAFQILTSKKHRTKCENQGFWPPKILPKPFQNPSKIDVREQT